MRSKVNVAAEVVVYLSPAAAAFQRLAEANIPSIHHDPIMYSPGYVIERQPESVRALLLQLTSDEARLIGTPIRWRR